MEGKHIESQFHFLREQVNKENLKLEYCNTKEKIADIFTKTLRVDRFQCLRDKLGVLSNKSELRVDSPSGRTEYQMTI
ncbi:Copia protein, partial [Mucuna pruriens]